MVSLIIPAAGQAKRMGLGYNKIFSKLKDTPILLETLLKFSKVSRIQEIIIAADKNEIDSIKSLINKISYGIPIKIVEGGSERQYSVSNALKEVSHLSDIVLVHDAARPLITIEIINNLIDEVVNYNAAAVAVPTKDTTAIVDEHNFIKEIPDRKMLWSIQTPQGFKKELLIQAFEKANQDNFLGTDETSVVGRLPHPVRLVLGDYTNIKITTPSDLIVSQLLYGKQTGNNVKTKLTDFVSSAISQIKKSH